MNGMAFDWRNYSWQAMSGKSLKSVHFDHFGNISDKYTKGWKAIS